MQAKTVAAHEASLKVAEKKALAQLQKVRAAPLVQVQRKPHWFERFNWFITRCARPFSSLMPYHAQAAITSCTMHPWCAQALGMCIANQYMGRQR